MPSLTHAPLINKNLCRRGAVVIATFAIVSVATPCSTAQPDPPRGRPISPLHDFLGIDADTGQFKPQTTQDPAPPPRSDTHVSRQETRQEVSSPETARPRPAPTIDDLPRTAEEANEAIRRVTERVGEGSLEDLASLFGESMHAHPVFQLHRQIVWIMVSLMLMYPLGIAVSGLLAYVTVRNRVGLTELDRRFQRTQLLRRLMLAAVLATVILLFGFGNAHSYWWNQPVRLAIFTGIILLMGSLAVVLARLSRQAVHTYELNLLRDIRREQLEMRADLDELRQQLKQNKVS
jgi:hypothetical protein